MVSEVQSKPEARVIKDQAVTSPLTVSNQEMFVFQSPVRIAGTAAEREHALFNNGFSFDQTSNIYAADKQLAQDVPRLPTPVPSPEQLGFTKETTLVAVELAQSVLKNWTSEHPIAGQESALMRATTAANSHAWEDAKSAFSQIQGVSEQLMKAYVRNELANYNGQDWMDDLAASTGHLRSDKATLGMSQISPKGVREFEERYPQLKTFLTDKGYGPGKEALALLDPACVAMIVAAKTATIVEDLQKHGIHNPTKEQLAYAFNPDVFSYQESGKKTYVPLYMLEVAASNAQHWDQKKEYYANEPEVINASKHVKNVLSWMKEEN